MNRRTWFEGVSDSSMKLIESLRNVNNLYRRDSNHFAKNNLTLFYRYDLSSNSCSVPTVVTESKSSSSEVPETKMLFSLVDGETLLLLQEVLQYHYSGGKETLIKWNDQTSKACCETDLLHKRTFNIDKVDLVDLGEIEANIDDNEDIFEGVGGIFDHNEVKRTRTRSLDRSLTPDLDEFIDDIYNFKEKVQPDTEVYSNIQSEVIKDTNELNYSTQKDFGKYTRGRSRKRGFDYSLLSRRGPVRSFPEKSLDTLKLPQFEDSTASYAECYLEVDGVSQYETHHEELESTNIRPQNKEIDDSLSVGGNSKQTVNKNKKKDKSINQEWKSIQRIMNKQNFKSLETFNSLISRSDGSI